MRIFILLVSFLFWLDIQAQNIDKNPIGNIQYINPGDSELLGKDIKINVIQTTEGISYILSQKLNKEGTKNDLVLYKIDSSHILTGSQEGIRLSNSELNKTLGRMTIDTKNNLWITWKESDKSGNKIFLKKISSENTLYSEPINIFSEEEDIAEIWIDTLNSEDLVISVLSFSNGVYQINSKKIKTNGSIRDIKSATTNVTGLIRNLKTIPLNKETLLICWEEFTGGKYWLGYYSKQVFNSNLNNTTEKFPLFKQGVTEQVDFTFSRGRNQDLLYTFQTSGNSASGKDIFCGYLDSTAAIKFLFPICFADGDQDNVHIVLGPEGFFVSWEDHRSQLPGIYSQFINPETNNFNWLLNGNYSGIKAENTALVSVSHEGSHFFIAAIQISGDRKEIVTSSYDKYGINNSTVQNFVLEPSNQENVFITKIKNVQGVYLPENTSSIILFKQDKSGKIVFENLIREIKESFFTYKNPHIFPAFPDGFYVIYEDYKSHSAKPDLLIQRFSETGSPLWNKNGIPVCRDSGEQKKTLIYPFTNGNVLVVWSDKSNLKDENLRYQVFNNLGVPLLGSRGASLCSKEGNQFGVSSIQDGSGGIIICWIDTRNYSKTGFDIYGQRITSEGTPIWDLEGKPLAHSESDELSPLLVESGINNFTLFLTYSFNGIFNIQYKTSDNSGNIISNSKTLFPSQFPQREICGSRDELGNLHLAWSDEKKGRELSKIYSAILSPEYELLKGPTAVNSYDTYMESAPRIFTIGKETETIFYTEKSSEGIRIRIASTVGINNIKYNITFPYFTDFEEKVKTAADYYKNVLWILAPCKSGNDFSLRTGYFKKDNYRDLTEEIFEGKTNLTAGDICIHPKGKCMIAWEESLGKKTKIGYRIITL